MLRRWREEKRKHLLQDGSVPHGFDQCRCSAGPGLMRKARPWDSSSHHYRRLHSTHRQGIANSNQQGRRQGRWEIRQQDT